MATIRAFNPGFAVAVIRLPEHVVNRIAAGEVIERPASVVKELVENAIDAGATRIDIVTANGGKNLIRVSDNGSGMGRSDLALAVERHCTSKLAEDLLDIRTLGFRGEALPSIGAVSRLTVTSRDASDPQAGAWSVNVSGGRMTEPRPAALSQGTVVEVEDLFFATPGAAQVPQIGPGRDGRNHRGDEAHRHRLSECTLFAFGQRSQLRSTCRLPI